MAEVWDEAQAAWAEYVAHNYFGTECIEAIRRGFLEGWRRARERDEHRDAQGRQY